MPDTVEFKFPLFTKVKTDMSTQGVITCRSEQRSGIMYVVQTKAGEFWFHESRLAEV